MIYFIEDPNSVGRWGAVQFRTNPITGERSKITHAVIREVRDLESYTIYWKGVAPGTRKMTTHHKGDLSGAQNKVLKARLFLTE